MRNTYHNTEISGCQIRWSSNKKSVKEALNDKEVRRWVYMRANELLEEKHFSAPFLCHIFSYILYGTLTFYSMETLYTLLPEFEEIGESTTHTSLAWDLECDFNSRFSPERNTVVCLCLALIDYPL